MHKAIILLFLAGQFVMTPERKAGIDQAAIGIKNKQMLIDMSNKEITRLQTNAVQLGRDKTKLIQDAKTKYGLDATWNWDDTTNTFVQTKK